MTNLLATHTSTIKKGYVEVENLSMTFSRRGEAIRVFDSINFNLDPGEFVCLLGPSGCGKSTVLNVIAGFIKPTSGYVFINKRHVDTPGSDRGFVFQQYSLLPWKTTFQNVEFGLKIRGIPKKERTDLVNDFLERVGLYRYRNAFPHQLSGGMQQRASIVRALVNSPSVLLMDEPFAALDAQTRHMMQELLLDVWQELRPTIIFVTHDIDEAVFLSDRILVMGTNPGCIKAEVSVALPRPRHIDIKLTEDFLSLNRQVFDLIREETLKNMINL
ncbi:ABC transporter ATP-binding protein [Thermostichus vulcanus]|uniref:ABC transporter ATP-binding protein n=1 Tax=Thermostichus vulcanus str. 'Rupite' TaxID=2813851 RepID=A0ABT0C6H4_THEVL|nr:ABC transporter ATP-binding protein [Thermostichus vulcanus]MCJ2541381.1 ABC transporter ATP-binding protein [Thermostichus vulcanus str. 'Rupite']